MQEVIPGFLEETQDLLEEYVNNRLQLLKLQTAEKSAKLISFVFVALAIALLFFFILLFISIMAGYYFAEKTGSQVYGFGIVACFYILLLLVVLLLRKKLVDKYISDKVIKIFFEPTENDDEADK